MSLSFSPSPPLKTNKYILRWGLKNIRTHTSLYPVLSNARLPGQGPPELAELWKSRPTETPLLQVGGRVQRAILWSSSHFCDVGEILVQPWSFTMSPTPQPGKRVLSFVTAMHKPICPPSWERDNTYLKVHERFIFLKSPAFPLCLKRQVKNKISINSIRNICATGPLKKRYLMQLGLGWRDSAAWSGCCYCCCPFLSPRHRCTAGSSNSVPPGPLPDIALAQWEIASFSLPCPWCSLTAVWRTGAKGSTDQSPQLKDVDGQGNKLF